MSHSRQLPVPPASSRLGQPHPRPTSISGPPDALKQEIAHLRRDLGEMRQEQRRRDSDWGLLGLGAAFLLGISLGDD